MRNVTETKYCDNCMCYVPEDVACADPECPIEGATGTDADEDASPLDFSQIQSMREVEPDDMDSLYDIDEESSLRDMLHGRSADADEEDPYCGC